MYVFNNFNTLNELGGSATSYIRENIPLIPKYLQNRKFTEFFPLSQNPYNQLSPIGKVGVVFFTALSFSILFLSIWKGVKCNYFQNTKIKKDIPSQSQDPEEDSETSNKEKIERQVRAIFHKLQKDLGKDLPANESMIYSRYPELRSLLSQMPQTFQKEFDKILGIALVKKRISNPTSLMGSVYEERVLKGLRCRITEDNDRKEVFEKIKRRLESLIDRIQMSSISPSKVKTQGDLTKFF